MSSRQQSRAIAQIIVRPSRPCRAVFVHARREGARGLRMRICAKQRCAERGLDAALRDVDPPPSYFAPFMQAAFAIFTNRSFACSAGSVILGSPKHVVLMASTLVCIAAPHSALSR